MTHPVGSDVALLRSAEQTLSDAGFTVQRSRIAEVQCLLAENRWFILALAATSRPEEFSEIDAAVSVELANRVAARQIRGKRWDVYLVMLSSEDVPDEHAELLFEMFYDTHYLRRLVRTGVAASPDSVAQALRTFLPLAEGPGLDQSVEPLALLEDALVTRGVERTTAERSISDFRTTGEIADA